MNERTALLARSRADLQAMLLADFPLARAMGLGVRTWDGRVLELCCPLVPNTNTHATAFAGSQFALAALCGWSLIHLLLRAAGVDASILFVHADIGYERPVTADLLARCDAGMFPEVVEEIERVARDGKCRIRLTVTVAATDGVGSVLHGTYALRRRDP